MYVHCWQDDNEIGELNCVIGMLEGQVQYTQEYISECQSQIMQIEEAKASLTLTEVSKVAVKAKSYPHLYTIFLSHWGIFKLLNFSK